MEENKEEMSELAPSYNEDLGEDKKIGVIVPTGIKGGKIIAAYNEGKTTVVEDDTLMDTITEKVKAVATRECPNVKATGRHSYADSQEIDKESLRKVWRCMCGKSILV
jgi:hypothetical protein